MLGIIDCGRSALPRIISHLCAGCCFAGSLPQTRSSIRNFIVLHKRATLGTLTAKLNCRVPRHKLLSRRAVPLSFGDCIVAVGTYGFVCWWCPAVATNMFHYYCKSTVVRAVLFALKYVQVALCSILEPLSLVSGDGQQQYSSLYINSILLL